MKKIVGLVGNYSFSRSWGVKICSFVVEKILFFWKIRNSEYKTHFSDLTWTADLPAMWAVLEGIMLAQADLPKISALFFFSFFIFLILELQKNIKHLYYTIPQVNHRFYYRRNHVLSSVVCPSMKRSSSDIGNNFSKNVRVFSAN